MAKLNDFQNHIESEKLVLSLLIACHHPGGKNSMSAGFSTAVIDRGSTFSTKSGSLCSGANTSISEVLLKAELGK